MKRFVIKRRELRSRTGVVLLIVGIMLSQTVEVNRANAERSQIDASLDPVAQAALQIELMMEQERAALDALTTDRLAELGGFSLKTVRRRGFLRGIFGGRSRAADDNQAAALASAAQDSTRDFEISRPETGFDMDMLDQMPVATGGPQWTCLTEALYFEARGESLRGQFAVSEVILNRVDSPRYPDTICDVVRQGNGRRNRCQFSFYCDGRAESVLEPVAFARAGKIARMMVDGRARVLTMGATHYHTTAVSPFWAASLQRTAVIGDHIFYRRPLEYAQN